MACGYNSSSAQRGKAGSSGWSSPNKSQLVAGGDGRNRSVVSSMKAKSGSFENKPKSHRPLLKDTMQPHLDGVRVTVRQNGIALRGNLIAGGVFAISIQIKVHPNFVAVVWVNTASAQGEIQRGVPP